MWCFEWWDPPSAGYPAEEGVRACVGDAALERSVLGNTLRVRRPGVERLIQPGLFGFLLGLALSPLLAGLHRARHLDRTGLLGQPHLAEIALADVAEDVGDLGLVQCFALQQLKRQPVQDVAVLGEDGVGLVVGLVNEPAHFLVHHVGDLVGVVALVPGVAA